MVYYFWQKYYSQLEDEIQEQEYFIIGHKVEQEIRQKRIEDKDQPLSSLNSAILMHPDESDIGQH